MSKYEMKGNGRHNSDKLDALLGKTVKLTYWDNRERTGVLRKSPYRFGYMLETPKGRYHFAKTLVKKVEVVK